LTDAFLVDQSVDGMWRWCQAEIMGFIDRLLGRRRTEPDIPPALPPVRTDLPRPRSHAAPDPADVVPDESGGWYVPQDSDDLLGPDGVPLLHLIPHHDTGGESLRLCEDRTGLLVGPDDRRLPGAGIHVTQLRGQAYHQMGCRAGDFRPGAEVRLVRDPDDEFDPDAVAVYDDTGRHLAGYVSNQKARILSRLIDSGQPIEAVSMCGTGPGRSCDRVVVLAASPDVMRRLLEPRPADLPTPSREA
jgi:hypothetical protein